MPRPTTAAAGLTNSIPATRLKLGELASFLRQPARYFFRRRLGVCFADAAMLGEDEEPFGLNALERYLLEDTMLDDGGEVEAVGRRARQPGQRAPNAWRAKACCRSA